MNYSKHFEGNILLKKPFPVPEFLIFKGYENMVSFHLGYPENLWIAAELKPTATQNLILTTKSALFIEMVIA